jgi:hypothetical protein
MTRWVQGFFDLARAYPRLSERTTLPISQKHEALDACAWSHSLPRAGYAPSVVILPAIDTVEVTDIDANVLSHGYVAAAEHVLFDITIMLHSDTPSDRRPRLKRSAFEGKLFRVLQEGR